MEFLKVRYNLSLDTYEKLIILRYEATLSSASSFLFDLIPTTTNVMPRLHTTLLPVENLPPDPC